MSKKNELKNATNEKRGRGRPETGKRGYTIRMLPSTKASLEASYGSIGDYLDKHAQELNEVMG